MNALLLIAAMLLAEPGDGPLSKAIAISEEQSKATAKEAKKLADLINSYARARIDSSADAGGPTLLPNGTFAFNNQRQRDVEITKTKVLLEEQTQRLDAAKKNKFYANDWLHEKSIKEVGDIGRYTKSTRIVELVDDNSIRIGFTNFGELNGAGNTIILKGVDTKKLLKGQQFICPPMMVCTEVIRPAGTNWVWYAVEPITIEQIKTRAEAERKQRDGK